MFKKGVNSITWMSLQYFNLCWGGVYLVKVSPILKIKHSRDIL